MENSPFPESSLVEAPAESVKVFETSVYSLVFPPSASLSPPEAEELSAEPPVPYPEPLSVPPAPELPVEPVSVSEVFPVFPESPVFSVPPAAPELPLPPEVLPPTEPAAPAWPVLPEPCAPPLEPPKFPL